jgi:hypothetical protein
MFRKNKDDIPYEEWYPWKVDGFRASLNSAWGITFWCSHGIKDGALHRCLRGLRCDTCGAEAPEELVKIVGYTRKLEDM